MLATVKVMRSHDYCHFEVQLARECKSLDEVNDLRKEAAILVDEAVRQYKTAKKKESSRDGGEWKLRELLDKIEDIKSKPRSEWSIEQAALIRGMEDHRFAKEFHEDDYYYCDPEREHHFSMLNKFKDVVVRAGAVDDPAESDR